MSVCAPVVTRFVSEVAWKLLLISIHCKLLCHITLSTSLYLTTHFASPGWLNLFAFSTMLPSKLVSARAKAAWPVL
jgi:hypothetical protein